MNTPLDATARDSTARALEEMLKLVQSSGPFNARGPEPTSPALRFRFTNPFYIAPSVSLAWCRMTGQSYTVSVMASVEWTLVAALTGAPLGAAGKLPPQRLMDVVVPPLAASGPLPLGATDWGAVVVPPQGEHAGSVLVNGRDFVIRQHIASPAVVIHLKSDATGGERVDRIRYAPRTPYSQVTLLVDGAGRVGIRVGISAFLRASGIAHAPPPPRTSPDFFLYYAAMGGVGPAVVSSELLSGISSRKLSAALDAAVAMSDAYGLGEDAATAAIAASLDVSPAVVRHYLDAVFMPSSVDARAKRALLAALWRARVLSPHDTDRDHLREARFSSPGSCLEDVFNFVYAGLPHASHSFVEGLERALTVALFGDGKAVVVPERGRVEEALRSTLSEAAAASTASIVSMYATRRLPNIGTRSTQDDTFMTGCYLERAETFNYAARSSQGRTLVLHDAPHDVARHFGHASWAGFIDASYGCEGPNSGVRNGAAAGAVLSLAGPVDEIRALLSAAPGVVALWDTTAPWILMFNGEPLAKARDGLALYGAYREARRVTPCLKQSSMRLEFATYQVVVWADAGRLVRPLLQVGGGPEPEFLDASEISTMVVVAETPARVGPTTTHVEVHPSLLLAPGILAAPFVNLTPPFRATLGGLHRRQAQTSHLLALHATHNGSFGQFQVLARPEYPLHSSRAVNLPWFTGAEPSPYGQHSQNVVIAIMQAAMNVEDAMIANGRSMRAGMGLREKSRIVSAVTIANRDLDPSLAADETTHVVPATDGKSPWLAEGLPVPGTVIPPNGVIVNLIARSVRAGDRKMPVRNDRFDAVRVEWVKIFPLDLAPPNASAPRVSRSSLHAYRGHGAHGILVKVSARDGGLPQVGDKMTTHAGGKGVTSCHADASTLPYDDEGNVPDLILNGDSLTARRIHVSTVLDMVLSAAVASDWSSERAAAAYAATAWVCSLALPCGARIPDTTPYEGDDVVGRVSAYADAKGLRVSRTLYDPATGRPLRTPICMLLGTTLFLKHLAHNKDNAAGTTTVRDPLTLQAVGGRQRGGPGMFGSMEGYSALSSGAEHVVAERRAAGNIPFQVNVCAACGRALIITSTERLCPSCGDSGTRAVTETYVRHAVTDIQLPGALCVEVRRL